MPFGWISSLCIPAGLWWGLPETRMISYSPGSQLGCEGGKVKPHGDTRVYEFTG